MPGWIRARAVGRVLTQVPCRSEPCRSVCAIYDTYVDAHVTRSTLYDTVRLMALA